MVGRLFVFDRSLASTTIIMILLQSGSTELNCSVAQEGLNPLEHIPVDTHITHFDQEAFPPDSIIGLLEVYEHRCGSLSSLEAVQGILDKSEQLVLCSTAPSKASLHVIQDLV